MCSKNNFRFCNSILTAFQALNSQKISENENFGFEFDVVRSIELTEGVFLKQLQCFSFS